MSRKNEQRAEAPVPTAALSKFERVKLLALRAAQLAAGAPSALPEPPADPVEAARAELERDVCPLYVARAAT